jgi:cytochrome c2
MTLMSKSILATVFLAAGLVATLLMLALMGRAERKVSPVVLRRLHKIFGGIFLVLLVVISYFCLAYVKMAGEGLTVRAVFHGVLALTLFIVLVLKISIVRFYREFMRFVPSLGLAVFVLAFLVYTTSAGYFFIVGAGGRSVPPLEGAGSRLSAEVENGRMLFARKCSYCHYADSDQGKLGPGLREVLTRETLPKSGRPATPENIREQLINPFGNMPSFRALLTEKEINELIAYLSTL